MAHALTGADTESASVPSNDSSSSMHTLDFNGLGSSGHTVHDWLATSETAWSSMLPLHPAPTWDSAAAAVMKHTLARASEQGTLDRSGKQPALAEQPAVADPAEQSTAAEHHTVAGQPIVARQHVGIERHTVAAAADQGCTAKTAARHACAQATKQQNVVATLVQRFEHLTVAKADTMQQGLACLLASSDQSLQKSPIASRMHLTPDNQTGRVAFSDTSAGDNVGGSASSRSMIHPRCKEAILDGWFSLASSRPGEWHMNASFEPQSSSAQLAATGESASRQDGLAASVAADDGTVALQCHVKGLVGPVNAGRVAMQDGGWPTTRYSLPLHIRSADGISLHELRPCMNSILPFLVQGEMADR